MALASTGVGDSAAMLRPPAAAITSVSFPNNEVISSTFSEFADLKVAGDTVWLNKLRAVYWFPMEDLIVWPWKAAIVVYFAHTSSGAERAVQKSHS
jgi:hypothetical protein